MSILIKGMKMPKNCYDCEFRQSGYPDWCDLSITCRDVYNTSIRQKWCPLIELPDHGDLIDIDKLSDAMYHEAFETDSDWQKWDSGCWIRYKLFERQRDSAPVVIPAERSEE